MTKPATKHQALIEVAEAVLRLPQAASAAESSSLMVLKAKARRALKMPNGNPNIVAVAEKGRAANKIKADESAAVIQARIRVIRAKGPISYAGIALELNRLGAPTPNGGKWHPASVRAAEKRPVVPST